MSRMLRRALRQWKEEFLSVWLRCTAFHRIVLGIVLAMGLVYGARVRVLDALSAEVEALSQELGEKGVPQRVPPPETDDELQQETFRAESLRESIETWTAELETAEAEAGIHLDASMSDAHATLLKMANRHGVRVHSKGPTNNPQHDAPRVAASAYEIRGRFPAVFAFLSGLSDAPLLWEFQQIDIELLGGADGMLAAASGGASPDLALRFHLLLHLYRRGDS